MRKLHLVGLTTDRDGLIFTARKGSKSGGFIVPLDDGVLAAVAEVQVERNGATAPTGAEPADVEAVPRRPRRQSALTPREMQARLRAGRSIDEVAAEAGVDNDWVARFAVPILAEQAQVVELARGLVYAKPRLGESSQRLGPSVMQNLSDRGVFIPDDIADAGWSAFQLHDSVWMVRFRYRSRGRDQEAQWEVDVPAGRLQARNRHASDLGYVDAGGRRRLLADEEPVDDDAASEATAPVRPARRSAARSGRPATKKAVTAAGRARLGTPASKSVRSSARPATGPARTRAVADAPAKKSARGKTPATKIPAIAKTAAKARTPAKAKTPTRGTTAPAAKTGPARPAKTAARTVPAKGVGAKTGATGRSRGPAAARPVKAATTAVAAPAKVGTRGGPAKAPATQRPAKAADGPTVHAGGVRSAVAQIATARVTASMASAERAPWAGVVAPRSLSRLAAANGNDVGGRRRNAPATPASARPTRQATTTPDDDVRPAFEPRPLPAGGDAAIPARVRKVPAPPVRPVGGTPPVILPAPRVPSPKQEPMPVERPKRRRLRPR